MQPLPYDRPDPLAHIVEFLEKTGQDDIAESVLDAFAKYSNNIEQFNLLAKLYLDIRANEKAEKFALKTLSMTSDPGQQYSIRANLAKLYNNINYPEKSLPYSEQNLTMSPGNPEILLEMVFSLYLLNRKEEAKKILYDLKANEHLYDDRIRTIINFNMGTYDMTDGKFLQGLAGFLINVKKLKIWFSPRELDYKTWTGQSPDYPGQTFIMFMEGGGIGDDFITIRFMDELKALGFNPVFYTAKNDVCKIFNQNGYPSVVNIDTLPKDSVWQYAMHVPLYLKSTPESIMREKYLQPTEEARAKWAWMKESKKLKVGVRWQGNSKNERDLHRKVPIEGIMDMLKETLKGQDVEFYSLQIDDGVEEIVKYPELISIADDIKSFDDTFAICENLDFVVTSCTSVLHASAIMGTETLGLVPISAYFTWISPCEREHGSIWYGDNLKIFQQVTPRKWDEPLAEISDYIKKNLI